MKCLNKAASDAVSSEKTMNQGRNETDVKKILAVGGRVDRHYSDDISRRANKFIKTRFISSVSERFGVR
jgi:hypothetical protein